MSYSDWLMFCDDIKTSFTPEAFGVKICRKLTTFIICLLVTLCLSCYDKQQKSRDGVVVKLLANRARGLGVQFSVLTLWFQRLVTCISCFQVAIWLKYSLSDINPQNNSQPTSSIFYSRYGSLTCYNFSQSDQLDYSVNHEDVHGAMATGTDGNSIDPDLPSQEEVMKKTEKITKNISGAL